MKATEGKLGRVFVIRLEDGDMLPACIERFADEKGIAAGQVILLGAIGSGQIVVGPRDSSARPPDPMLLPIDGVHEIVGVGIIAPGENGKPGLHVHASLGRSGHTVTGDPRPGISTWVVAEAIIMEITGAKASRLPDKETGFNLLEV